MRLKLTVAHCVWHLDIKKHLLPAPVYFSVQVILSKHIMPFWWNLSVREDLEGKEVKKSSAVLKAAKKNMVKFYFLS